MERRTLYITVNSAKDLKDVNLFSTMDVYADVSILGDNVNNNASQQRTHTVKRCGPNPKWNFAMEFAIDVNAAKQDCLALAVKIKAEKKLAPDKEVGEVLVRIKDLLESYGEESKDERHAIYSVKTPSGKAKGVLDFTYKFGEKSVTGNPVGGPAHADPPPGMLAAGTVAAAYPYANQPPPPMYGGYLPQPAHNGGYPQYPHQPAPYPQAGYAARPPGRQAGYRIGRLDALQFGYRISNESEMGAYDSGYDAGFDDAGF